MAVDQLVRSWKDEDYPRIEGNPAGNIDIELYLPNEELDPKMGFLDSWGASVSCWWTCVSTCTPVICPE